MPGIFKAIPDLQLIYWRWTSQLWFWAQRTNSKLNKGLNELRLCLENKITTSLIIVSEWKQFRKNVLKAQIERGRMNGRTCAAVVAGEVWECVYSSVRLWGTPSASAWDCDSCLSHPGPWGTPAVTVCVCTTPCVCDSFSMLVQITCQTCGWGTGVYPMIVCLCSVTEPHAEIRMIALG